MRCPLCERDVRGICLCGICLDCIKQYGHTNCQRMIKEKEEQKKK